MEQARSQYHYFNKTVEMCFIYLPAISEASNYFLMNHNSLPQDWDRTPSQACQYVNAIPYMSLLSKKTTIKSSLAILPFRIPQKCSSLWYLGFYNDDSSQKTQTFGSKLIFPFSLISIQGLLQVIEVSN